MNPVGVCKESVVLCVNIIPITKFVVVRLASALSPLFILAVA